MDAHFFVEAVQKRPDTSTGALASALKQLGRASREAEDMVELSPQSRES